MEKVNIAVIGGSGLYSMKDLTNIEEVKINTPFGDPSDSITIGTLEKQRIAFLPRHGRGHRLTPTEVNSRANIYALKSIGVEHIISVSAVGSMKIELAPMNVVIPDQLFDNTKKRISSFFGDGIVGHISFAEPFCPVLSDILYNSAKEQNITVHKGGTYICIEGPQFSTKAESRIYRQWGVDVIGMTAVPEAKLAREANICYSIMAMVTDYDVWHEEEVNVAMVVQNLNNNVANAQKIIKSVINKIPKERKCVCASASKNAVMTNKDLYPEETKKKIELILK